MIILQTHNQALMWSRFGRMFAVMAAVALIVAAEYIVASQPTLMISSVSIIIAQFVALKCWADMIFMSEPYKNCWAFKE